MYSKNVVTLYNTLMYLTHTEMSEVAKYLGDGMQNVR